MAMWNCSSNNLFHSRCMGVLGTNKTWWSLEYRAWVNSKHFWLTTSYYRCFILSVTWLGKVMFKLCIAKIFISALCQRLRIMGDVKIALSVRLLLRVKIRLNCISVIVKILMNILLSTVILICLNFHSLAWVLERRINSNLIVKNRLIFSMLDTQLFVLILVNCYLHRCLAYMCLLNRSTLLSLKLNIVHIHMIVLIVTCCAIYCMFQWLSHLWGILASTLLVLYCIWALSTFVRRTRFWPLFRTTWLMCWMVIKKSLSRGLIEASLIASIVETSSMSMRWFKFLAL
jgi:hypothetical protein